VKDDILRVRSLVPSKESLMALVSGGSLSLTEYDGKDGVWLSVEGEDVFVALADGLTSWHKGSHEITKNHDGTPKVFYHATRAEPFTEFQGDGLGIHVGTADQSNSMAYNKGGPDYQGIHTYPVHIRAENPFRMRDLGLWDARGISKMLSTPTFPPNALVGMMEPHESARIHELSSIPQGPTPDHKANREARSILKNVLVRHGHDAIVYANRHEDPNADSPHDSFIVFHPHQVKSAIANDGSYDGTNKNIHLATPFDDSKLDDSNNFGEVRAKKLSASCTTPRTADSLLPQSVVVVM
jgi:hypothetical protein